MWKQLSGLCYCRSQWEKQLPQISEHLGSHTADHYLLSTAHLVPLYNYLCLGAKESDIVPASVSTGKTLHSVVCTHLCQVPTRAG